MDEPFDAVVEELPVGVLRFLHQKAFAGTDSHAVNQIGPDPHPDNPTLRTGTDGKRQKDHQCHKKAGYGVHSSRGGVQKGHGQIYPRFNPGSSLPNPCGTTNPSFYRLLK